jgi:hypothetical protein
MPECGIEIGLRSTACAATSPGDEAVGTNEHGAIGIDAVRCSRAAIDVAQITGGFKASCVDVERRRLAAIEQVGPELTCRAIHEHPLVREHVDR